MERSGKKKSIFKKYTNSIFSCVRNTTQPRYPSRSTPPPPEQQQPAASPSSPPPSSSSSLLPLQVQPPSFYLCPISNTLMSDPIILPPGISFERNCFQACLDFDYNPPTVILPSPSSSSPSASSSCSSFILTPNLALKHAILHWCHYTNHPPPNSVSPVTAATLVSRLVPGLPPPPPPSSPAKSPYSPSSSSSSETYEQRILNKLKKTKFSSRESGLADLIKTPLCTEPILNVIIPFLTNQLDDNLQALAAAAIFALADDPANRTMILYSGIIQPLLGVLNTGSLNARASATGAIYKLAMEEENRIPIGYALSAVRPLLNQFLSHSVGRKKATLALYYLCLRPENLSVLVDIGGVEKLMEKVGEEGWSRKSKRYALILLYCMMGIEKGRKEVLETGGISKVLLRRVKEEEEVGVHCLMVMYRICRESMVRFREVVNSDSEGGELEEVLVEEVEEWGEHGKELARGMVNVLRGVVCDGKELKEVEVVVESMEREDHEKDKDEEEEEEGSKGKKKVT